LRTRLLCLALAAAPSLAPSLSWAQDKPQPAKPAAKPAAATPGHTVGEVVVTGQGPALQTSIDRRSYDVTKDLQATGGSIGEALRNLPAVQVDPLGNVSLRGDPNVTILIDGKPSSMFEGDSKAQSLQAMPANQIERVEVITNPSAEFRADGTAGIINLVTKKARGAGATGSAKLTAANHGRMTASLNGGYNSKTLSVSGDLNLRHDNQLSHTVDDRHLFDVAAGGFDEIRQTQVQYSQLDFDSARAAIDYDLSPKTRLSAEIRGTYIDVTYGGPAQFVDSDPAGATTSLFERDLDLHQLRANGVASATLRHSFAEPGRELTVSLTSDVTNDDRTRAGRTLSFTPPAPASFDKQRLNYDYDRTQLKADYVHPMGEGATLKAGLDLEYDDNSYRNLGTRGPAAEGQAFDPSLSNLFLFRQSIDQAYVTYERPFGDLTVLAGLRAEDVRIDLDQATVGRKDRNAYTRFYPSLHLSWTLDDRQKLTASYSHRVQRPNPLQFNTFPILLDPVNLRAGNAGLKPQETHSFEAGYEYRSGPTIYLATLYYRENFNGFSDVVRDIGNGVFLTTAANISKSRTVGADLVANGRLSKSLTYNVSSTIGWTEIDPQPLGSPTTRSAVSLSGRGNLTWQVTPKDLVQFNGFLNGKQLTSQGFFEPLGALNIGYRHKFDDRFAFVLTVQDMLHNLKFTQVIDTPTLKVRNATFLNSRQIQAGFTWTFGGGKPRDPGFDFGAGGGGGGPGGPP